MAFIGTFNQKIQFSKKIGGYRRIFEGQVKLIEGGFSANLSDLPAAGNVLPAGTPMYCDESTRKAVPLITYNVIAVDTAKNVIKVEKKFSGTRAKVGGYVMVLPAADLSTSGTAMQITAIDNSNDDYDLLTVDAVAASGSTSYNAVPMDDLFTPVTPESGDNPYSEGWYIKTAANTYTKCTDTDTTVVDETVYCESKSPKALGLYEDNAGATATTDTEVNLTKTYYEKVVTPGTAYVSANDIIADCKSEGKLKVTQVNALAPYDTCLDPEAIACDLDGAYACFDRSVLVRRMPPVNDAIWASLKANDCYFRRSNRK